MSALPVILTANEDVPALDAWQMQFNGVVFGAGTDYSILGVEGLDLPVVRNGDVARSRDTGEFIGLDLLGGRDITLTLDCASIAGANLQADLTTLATAFAPPVGGQTESVLWIQMPNLPLLAVACRVRKRQIPIDLAWSQGLASKIIIALHCTDPRLYGETSDQVIQLSSGTSGMMFPATFPLSFGGAATPGTLVVNNTGNIEMRPIIVITGPVTNPTITNETTGLSMTFSNPSQSSYTLNSGDTLAIDLDAHSVLWTVYEASTSSSVRSWVVNGSTWWDLPPGINTISFTSSDGTEPSPAPTCAVEWAPTSISLT
jgi:hypothetical protein